MFVFFTEGHAMFTIVVWLFFSVVVFSPILNGVLNKKVVKSFSGWASSYPVVWKEFLVLGVQQKVLAVIGSLFVGGCLGLVLDAILWFGSLLLEYFIVVILIIAIIGYFYYKYQQSLKEALARNGNIAHKIMVDTMISLADEMTIFEKARDKNVRKVCHSKYSKGDVKNHIYDGRILLLQGEFEEREVLDSVAEKIDVICEDGGHVNESREPLFELLIFYQHAQYIYYTIGCTENEDTKMRFQELRDQRDKIEGYVDVRELRDNDY